MESILTWVLLSENRNQALSEREFRRSGFRSACHRTAPCRGNRAASRRGKAFGTGPDGSASKCNPNTLPSPRHGSPSGGWAMHSGTLATGSAMRFPECIAPTQWNAILCVHGPQGYGDVDACLRPLGEGVRVCAHRKNCNRTKSGK